MLNMEQAKEMAKELLPKAWRIEPRYPHEVEFLAVGLTLGITEAEVRQSLSTGSPNWRVLVRERIEAAGAKLAPAAPSAPMALDVTPPVQS